MTPTENVEGRDVVSNNKLHCIIRFKLSCFAFFSVPAHMAQDTNGSHNLSTAEEAS